MVRMHQTCTSFPYFQLFDGRAGFSPYVNGIFLFYTVNRHQHEEIWMMLVSAIAKHVLLSYVLLSVPFFGAEWPPCVRSDAARG